MSLEHRVINTLEELEVICRNKNSVRITYTNVFSHLRSRDRKLRVFFETGTEYYNYYLIHDYYFIGFDFNIDSLTLIV